MVDTFYTPPPLCAKIVDAVVSRPTVVADFAAGSGELLKAAFQKWPSACYVATDISSAAVRILRKNGKWSVGRCDFLKNSSRKKCHPLRDLEGRVSLVLLNPPFSYRGGSYCCVNLAGITIRCSKAMAFLLNAVSFLAPGGQIVAVMPSGSLRSQRDEQAWSVIQTLFKVENLATNGHRTFAGCVTRTCIVRLRPQLQAPTRMTSDNRSKVPGPPVKIYRGKIQMHAVPKRKPARYIELVHSTSLKNHAVEIEGYRVNKSCSQPIKGPMILMPRVGKPDVSKVVLYGKAHPVVLSDCVFALKAALGTLEEIYSRLTQNWESIEHLYRGTGARYVTAFDLATVLRSNGFEVQAGGGKRPFQLEQAVARREQNSFTVTELIMLNGESRRLSGLNRRNSQSRAKYPDGRQNPSISSAALAVSRHHADNPLAAFA